jgi:hypothetical protein
VVKNEPYKGERMPTWVDVYQVRYRGRVVRFKTYDTCYPNPIVAVAVVKGKPLKVTFADKERLHKLIPKAQQVYSIR